MFAMVNSCKKIPRIGDNWTAKKLVHYENSSKFQIPRLAVVNLCENPTKHGINVLANASNKQVHIKNSRNTGFLDSQSGKNIINVGTPKVRDHWTDNKLVCTKIT